jgi:hypothetical protein
MRKLGGSSRIIRAAGRIIKPGVDESHMMILCNRGETPTPSIPCGVGGSLGENY